MLKNMLFGLCVVIMAIAGCDSGGDDAPEQLKGVVVDGKTIQVVNNSGKSTAEVNPLIDKIQYAFDNNDAEVPKIKNQVTAIKNNPAFIITIDASNNPFSSANNNDLTCGAVWLSNLINNQVSNALDNFLSVVGTIYYTMHNPAEALRLAGVYASGVGTAL
jgi:hypothetical protein